MGKRRLVWEGLCTNGDNFPLLSPLLSSVWVIVLCLVLLHNHQYRNFEPLSGLSMYE